MDNGGIPKYTTSFGLSLALASVANAILVVAKEKIPAVMAGMQRLTGQHWVSHSATVLVVFVFFGWLFARIDGGRGIKLTANRLIGTLMVGVASGATIIVGFYLIGD